jgi:ribosome biogenesis GTPase
MREFSLWDAEGLQQTFGDVDEIVARCRFGNCRHNGEPGCAIAAARADGTLAADRLESWRKLQRETAHHERRVDALARTEERRKWKAIGKSVTKHMNAKYGAEGW